MKASSSFLTILKKIDLSRCAGTLARSKDPIKTFYKALEKRYPFVPGMSVSDVKVSKNFEELLHHYLEKAFKKESSMSVGMYWLDRSPASWEDISNLYEVWYTKS